MAMDKEACRALLPNVGDEFICKPTPNEYSGWKSPDPKPCVVVYVNHEHLWYRVRYNDGTHECFKVPNIEPKGGQGLRFK